MSGLHLSARAAFLILGSGAWLPAQTLTPENFAKWKSLILPAREDLAWRKIPWRHEFREALVEAGEQGKPLLLWVMNGHPLGCT